MKLKMLVLCGGHFAVDMFSGFFPMYMVLAGLDMHAAGYMAFGVNFISNLAHPVFGLVSDNIRGRLYMILTIVLGGFFMAVLGLVTSNYFLIFIFLFAGKIAIAAFHPMGARLAGRMAKGSGGLSIFTFGGTLGFGMSHFVLERFTFGLGLGMMPLLALLGLIMGIIYALRGPVNVVEKNADTRQGLAGAIKQHWKTLLILFSLVVLRSVLQFALVFSLPKLYQEWGYARWTWGLSTGVLIVSGALAMLVCGIRGSNWNAKKIILYGKIVSLVLVLLFLRFGGENLWLSLFLLAVLGPAIYAAMPYNVSLGQSIMPEQAGTVSGILMGMAWALGTFPPAFIGWFSGLGFEWWGGGLVPSLIVLSLSPLGGIFLAMALFKKQ
ncbi:MAG: MFS transporter [bacterium]